MKFTDTRSVIQGFSGAQTAEYQMQYIASEVQDVLGGLNNRFVEFFTKDVVDNSEVLDLKVWLGKTYYGPSNDNAKDCLEICLTVKNLYGRRIKAWTDHALKCFDNFLLKYIQDDLKERIKIQYTSIKERDVYKHLIDKGGELQEVGQAFDLIYQTRNEFQHVQVVEQNGSRVPRNLSNTKCNEKRDAIVGLFRFGLNLLIKNKEELCN